MGKFRSKLKGQTKGKRWPKGQSSVSNPETKRYREAARNGFFQQNTGPSNLTFDALKKHDQSSFKIPSAPSMHSESDMMDSESLASSYQSMQSFASDWSGCTNMSYARFLNVFRSDSALHKEMLAILSAIAEVIKENGGTESPVEYYSALFTTLEQLMSTEDRKEEQVTAVLSLINMGIKSVPQPVLRLHFEETSKKILQIVEQYASSENNAIMKALFGILSATLRAQELGTWSQPSTLQMFNALLNPFCLHSKPKFRRAAQQAVIGIVKANCFIDKTSTNPPADKVAEFCEEVLNACMGSNSNTVVVSTVQTGQTTINHVLGLMKETICTYSKVHIKNCCEIAIRLIKLNYPLVTSCSLQVLYSLFSAQCATVPAKLNAQIITALYECQPSHGDVQPTQAWLLVMQQAHIHLSDVDLSMSAMALPIIFANVINLWLCEKPEIVGAATRALEAMIQEALAPIVETPALVSQHFSKIEKCINAIEQGLGYQYHSAWHNVLYTLKILFEVCGVNCYNMLTHTLKSLSELRDSYKFSFNSELEHAVGAAVRSMGPENVLKIISMTKDNGDLNIDRSWMIPVLKENIKSCTLKYFVNGILPLAVFCQRKSAELTQMNDGIRAHSYELFYNQLWNLLPSFCNNPTDVKDNFKSIAKVMGTAISDRKELRLSVMASLRKLIISAKQNEREEDIAELARFDKNYLPILFNVYTTKPIGSDEEGQRLAALDTIKVYLWIARPEIIETLLNSAMGRVETETEDPFIKESIFDLIRCLVPYVNKTSLQIVFDKCVKGLPTIKESKEQKKAYRILEEICSNESETCKQFVKSNCKAVQKLLLKSLNSAAVSSKGARLRCLNYLVTAQPHLEHDSVLLKSVVPEAILCCKDINEKCRAAAHQLLYTVGETLQKHNQMEQFTGMLVTGFTGTQQIMSCSILAVASVLHQFSGALGIQNIKLILENITNLMTAPTREIVSSCLSFIKVYLKAMPNVEVAASIPVIMKGLTNMTDDCQRTYRTKVRDILDRLLRKYGSESLTPHIPTSDAVMYKRLRNLRKINARKKKQKDGKKENDSDDEDHEDFIVQSKPKSIEAILADSDSEMEEMEVDTSSKNKSSKSKAWIEEDGDEIVDFIDNNARSKITTTKPDMQFGKTETNRKKRIDRGLKTAADGRLIITDDSSDSDSEKQKKKRKFVFDSDSPSDESDDEDAATKILTNNKRKRTDTSSMKSGFSTVSSVASSKYKAGGSGIHRPLKPRFKDDGSQYKAKKAKGDTKKKDKHDPYAYLPLQRSALNKRMKAKNAGRFKQSFNTGKKSRK